jgi:AcrR family transcriptional regulator
MASIAETAQMSAGLMYRYFENKSAIVLAIIERELQEGRSQIAQLRSSSELVAALLDVFTRWQARDPGAMSVALFLEMSAEATRDPQIAAALRRSDALILSDLAAWMNRAREDGGLGLPPETVATRAFLLECFIRGLAVTAVRHPDIDAATVRASIDSVVSRLLSP